MHPWIDSIDAGTNNVFVKTNARNEENPFTAALLLVCCRSKGSRFITCDLGDKVFFVQCR